MMKIDEATREKLRAPMPDEAIKQHPTKTFLSTIKAIYITERLNDVFGIGGWGFDHEIISDEPDYVTICGAISIIDTDAQKPTMQTPFQYGGHKKTGKNTEPADGYKSAVTDCISKCASYLEIGIDVFKGLADPPKGEKTPTKKPAAKKQPAKDGEMTKKQWDFIENLGAETGLSQGEVITLVKWVAESLNVEPRHWKVAKALLPVEKFQEQIEKHNEWRMTQ